MSSDLRTSAAKKKLKVAPSKRRLTSEICQSLYGWTSVVIQGLMKAENDDERIKQIQQVLSFTEESYNYDIKASTQIDFHFGNLLFCMGENYSVKQTQLVFKIMSKLLDDAMKACQIGDLDFDYLKGDLIDKMRRSFTELSAPDSPFTLKQTETLLSYVSQTFIKPIRLVMMPFYKPITNKHVVTPKRIFQPTTPDPLDECVERLPVLDEDKQFPLLAIPRSNEMNLGDLKRMIQQYTDNVIETINKRYDLLEAEMAKNVTPLLNQ